MKANPCYPRLQLLELVGRDQFGPNWRPDMTSILGLSAPVLDEWLSGSETMPSRFTQNVAALGVESKRPFIVRACDFVTRLEAVPSYR